MLADILAGEHEVVVATSPEEALSVLGRERLDAVVCDQVMPTMNGVALLQRSIALQPDAVRILITATDRVADAREAVNIAHVSRFLAKPLRPIEVVDSVSSALRERSLELEKRRLRGRLEEQNAVLERAFSEIRANEQRLEREVEARTRELKEAMAQLEELALRDGLTGLYNHRFFQEALKVELARAKRYQRVVSLLFLDVDHFKAYNDQWGHPAGDRVLQRLARILDGTEEVPAAGRGRSSDIAARYGGEEFVVILPETPKAGAALRANRLRAGVESSPFEGRESHPGGRLTVSVGVATWPEDAPTASALVEAADRALLRAKRAGRNRVEKAAAEPTGGAKGAK